MQLTLGNAESLGKRNQTRREIFRPEMERSLLRPQLLDLIEPHWTVAGRPGRQPFGLAKMLQSHLLQHSYAPSPQMEGAVHRSRPYGGCSAY